MTPSTENNKIKNKDMTAGNEKNDEEVVDEEESDTFNVDHSPESVLEEGKRGGTGMHKRGVMKSKALSTMSLMYDIDGDGELDEAEQAMRDMDTDNLGHLTNEKVYKVMMDQLKLQQEVFSLKRMSIALVMVIALLSVATLGTSFAAATLAKDTNIVNGNLVVKADGGLVATRSRGSQLIATVEASFLERRRRRKLGLVTVDDRRFLQQTDKDAVATVSKQTVLDGYHALQKDGTPVTVTFQIDKATHTKIGSRDCIKEDDKNGSWFKGLHFEDQKEPIYNIYCAEAAKYCDIFMELECSGKLYQECLEFMEDGLCAWVKNKDGTGSCE
jgi:hypothetical protein